MADHYDENPAKRRRLSDCRSSSIETSSSNLRAGSKTHLSRINGKAESTSSRDPGISIASNSKLASQTIAPFLTRHIPQQYAPQGPMEKSKNPGNKDPNTKYCYRHRPDLKCRRQVDEPSMDQLQKELETLSQSDQQGIAHVWALFSAAPSKHRNLMLKGILAQCCFPQLSLLSHSVRELIRIDYLSALPPELGFKILCYLDTTSLCKAAQVSRNWRSLADDNVVWHRMCEQHIDRKCTKCGWGLPLLEQKRLRASKRQIQLRATGRGINTWSPNITPLSEYSPRDTPSEDRDLNVKEEREFETSHKTVLNVNSSTEDSKGSYFPQRFRPWKDVYKDRFKVGSNWKHGRYSTKIFKGHTNGVMCLQFNDQVLATGSYDTTIKIWDLETGKELRTLRSHTLGIRCLQFDDNKLISGSLDKTLKVWNWRTGECIRTLTGHSAGVISLHFVSTLLVSGSIDKTVRIWNFEEKSSCVLRGHDDWVNAVKIDLPSRTIFSASDDLTVRLWDLDTKTVIKSYKGHVGQVQQVLPLPPEFEIEDTDAEPQDSGDDSASSISGPEVAARDVSRSTHLPSTFGPLFEDGTRPLPPRYMLTSALDSTVRLWDVATGKSLRTFFGHVEGVWALAADTLRVVSGAEDKMVKVWDARSGKCERTFYCHAGPVTCIGLSDSRLCTGSEDCEVRMLSFKTEGLGDATHEEGMGRSDSTIDTLA